MTVISKEIDLFSSTLSVSLRHEIIPTNGLLLQKVFDSCFLETGDDTLIQLAMPVLAFAFYKWVLKPFVLTYLEM